MNIIKEPLVYFKNLSAYDSAWDGTDANVRFDPNTKNDAIIFVEDSGKIYTHGHSFGGSGSSTKPDGDEITYIIEGDHYVISPEHLPTASYTSKGIVQILQGGGLKIADGILDADVSTIWQIIKGTPGLNGLKGDPGEDGFDPYIGEDGYWYTRTGKTDYKASGEGNGEPSQYLKSASVSNNILTITDNNDGTITANLGGTGTANVTVSQILNSASDTEQIATITVGNDTKAIYAHKPSESGEPSTYLKDASISNNHLLIKNKNNTPVVDLDLDAFGGSSNYSEGHGIKFTTNSSNGTTISVNEDELNVIKSVNINSVLEQNTDTEKIATITVGTTSKDIYAHKPTQGGEPAEYIKSASITSGGKLHIRDNADRSVVDLALPWLQEGYNQGTTYTEGEGIAINNNAISLKKTTQNTLGGVKVGYTTDNANRKYAVNVDNDGNAYVNVPWIQYNPGSDDPEAPDFSEEFEAINNSITDINNTLNDIEIRNESDVNRIIGNAFGTWEKFKNTTGYTGWQANWLEDVNTYLQLNGYFTEDSGIWTTYEQRVDGIEASTTKLSQLLDSNGNINYDILYSGLNLGISDIDGLESAVAGLQTSKVWLDGNKDELAYIISGFRSVANDVEGFAEVYAQKTDVQNNASAISALQTRVTGVESAESTLASRINNSDTGLSALNTKVTAVDNKVDSAVATLTTTINNKTAGLLLKTDLDEQVAGLFAEDKNSNTKLVIAGKISDGISTATIEANRVHITGNTYLDGVLSAIEGRFESLDSTLMSGDYLFLQLGEGYNDTEGVAYTGRGILFGQQKTDMAASATFELNRHYYPFLNKTTLMLSDTYDGVDIMKKGISVNGSNNISNIYAIDKNGHSVYGTTNINLYGYKCSEGTSTKPNLRSGSLASTSQMGAEYISMLVKDESGFGTTNINLTKNGNNSNNYGGATTTIYPGLIHVTSNTGTTSSCTLNPTMLNMPDAKITCNGITSYGKIVCTELAYMTNYSSSSRPVENEDGTYVGNEPEYSTALEVMDGGSVAVKTIVISDYNENTHDWSSNGITIGSDNISYNDGNSRLTLAVEPIDDEFKWVTNGLTIAPQNPTTKEFSYNNSTLHFDTQGFDVWYGEQYSNTSNDNTHHYFKHVWDIVDGQAAQSHYWRLSDAVIVNGDVWADEIHAGSTVTCSDINGRESVLGLYSDSVTANGPGIVINGQQNRIDIQRADVYIDADKFIQFGDNTGPKIYKDSNKLRINNAITNYCGTSGKSSIIWIHPDGEEDPILQFGIDEQEQSNPDIEIKTYGDCGRLYFNSPNGFYFNGDIAYSGSHTQASDSNLKNIGSDITLTAEQVANAPAVNFTWKNDENNINHVGSIAQYWQVVMPEVVSETKNGLGLDYSTTALMSAITVAKELVALKEEIAQLKAQINELTSNN